MLGSDPQNLALEKTPGVTFKTYFNDVLDSNMELLVKGKYVYQSEDSEKVDQPIADKDDWTDLNDESESQPIFIISGSNHEKVSYQEILDENEYLTEILTERSDK